MISLEAIYMAITTKEGILKVLSAYNPWWKTGVVNPKLSRTYKRFAFYEAMKRISDDRGLACERGSAAENRFYFYGSPHAEAEWFQ